MEESLRSIAEFKHKSISENTNQLEMRGAFMSRVASLDTAALHMRVTVIGNTFRITRSFPDIERKKLRLYVCVMKYYR